MKKITLTLSSWLLCFFAIAQLPTGFNYQVVVRNSEGQPIANQDIEIQISLTNVDETVVHYVENHSVITSPQGIVSLPISEGTAVSGDFSTVPWAEGGIYLKVEVDINGGTNYVELGTTKLQAVPYSLFAADGNEGPQGEPGLQGEAGNDGLSAYELWLAQGNTGTETDFLAAIKGDEGEPGEAGMPGEAGLDGKTILNGTSNPTSGVGVDGDFYLNTSTSELFGPKASDSWPSTGVSLIGPEGPEGPEGVLVSGNIGQTLIHNGADWEASNNIYVASGDVGIGTTTPSAKLDVIGDIRSTGKMISSGIQVGEPISDPDQPLFVVRNSNNEIVFAVYEAGVRMYVDSDIAKAGSKGGFAVGGLTQSKAGEEYFRVTPDSVRVYIDTTSTQGKSGSKGGFAVGGLTQSKGNAPDLLRVAGDSTRIYVGSGASKSGSKGGFAVGGLTQSKETPVNYLRVTKDSTRIYIDDSVTKSGSKGGFAVGGLTQSKTSNSILFLTPENYFIGHESGLKTIPISENLGKYNNFFGFQSGKENTQGAKNIFIGYKSGLTNTFGHGNIFIGYLSGFSNMSGSNNLFVGNQSGYSNSNGFSNMFIGDSTGYFNTSGYSNTFIGMGCGYKNETGIRNLFIGNKSGYMNISGGTNTFVGNLSGYNNTEGDDNTFIGNYSGYSNVDGEMNTLIGTFSASKMNIGSYNVSIGASSGNLFEEGSSNTFVGSQSGAHITSGSSNVFIGAGTGNTGTSSFNVYIGQQVGQSAENKTGNVIIGHQAGLSIAGENNVIIGYHAGKEATGSDNVYIGYRAGYSATGDKKLYIAHNAQTPIIYGDFESEMVGINTTDPQQPLDVNGNTRVRGYLLINNTETTTDASLDVQGVSKFRTIFPIGTIPLYTTAEGHLATSASDVKLKTNITQMEGSLQKVKMLRGVNFSWRSDTSKTKRIGFIAQEVESILPELVFTNPSDGFKGVNYAEMTAVLVEAIKEQQVIIENQQAQIDELKQKDSEIEKLKAELEAIKAMLSK